MKATTATSLLRMAYAFAMLAAVASAGEAAAPEQPGNAPGAKSAQTPLRNTYWKLVALNGKPAVAFKDQREPHLVLKGDEMRVSGSGGCNNVMGGFELDGARLRFTQMASTMMMCPKGMEQEGAFLKTLETVARYRIGGDALTLADNKGKAVAKFRAVALR